jgi:hypothetical protein
MSWHVIFARWMEEDDGMSSRDGGKKIELKIIFAELSIVVCCCWAVTRQECIAFAVAAE